MNMTVTWAMLIPVFLVILVFLLIDGRRRRVAGGQDLRTMPWIALACLGVAFLFLGVCWVAVFHFGAVQQTDMPVQKVAADAIPKLPTIAGLPAPRESIPTETAEKGDDEYSQAVASKTVGMLRAMVRALGRALVEEEKSLAEKKGGTKPTAMAPPVTKPAWVNASPCLMGDVYRMSVSVGPYTSRAECDAQLPDALQKALDHYVEACLGDQTSEEVRLPVEELRQKAVKGFWEETRQYSVGPMIQLHALLEFDREMKGRVLDTHRQAIVDRRLHLAAIWASLGLSVLGVMFGYLKTDLATGGAYRGRLRWLAFAAIAGVVALAATVGYF